MDTQRQGSLGPISEPACHTLFPGKPARQHFPVPQGQPSDWVLATEQEQNEIYHFQRPFSFHQGDAYRQRDCGNSMWKMDEPRYGSISCWISSWTREEGTSWIRNTLLDLISAESHLLSSLKHYKGKGSRSVMSDSQRPHGLQPTRLLRPWDFPGKSTGVGCHCLLQKHYKLGGYCC